MSLSLLFYRSAFNTDDILMEAKELSNQSLTIRLAVKLPPCVEGNAFEPDTSVSTSSDTKGQSIESGET